MADGPLTLTMKGGGDFKEPWLVVSGSDWNEIATRLATVPGFTDEVLKGIAEYIAQNQPLGTGVVAQALDATPVPTPAAVAVGPGPAVAAAASAATEAKDIQIKDPDAPASQKQLDLIKKLKGVVPPGGLTKGAASAYIDELMANRGS